MHKTLLIVYQTFKRYIKCIKKIPTPKNKEYIIQLNKNNSPEVS